MDSSPVRFLTKRGNRIQHPHHPSRACRAVTLVRRDGDADFGAGALEQLRGLWSSRRRYGRCFPYVIFNFASPLLLIVLAILGFRRIRDDNGLPNETTGAARP